MGMAFFFSRLFGRGGKKLTPAQVHFSRCKPFFDGMDRRRKAAFFAVTSQQILPLYVEYSAGEPWRNPELIKKGIAYLEDIADGRDVPAEELNEFRKRLIDHIDPGEGGELDTPLGISAMMNTFELDWYLAFAASGEDADLEQCFLGCIYDEIDDYVKVCPSWFRGVPAKGCTVVQRERELRLLQELAAEPELPADWRERYREFTKPLVELPKSGGC